MVIPALPIESAIPELLAALERSRNVVLQAPPGAGKSTRVPLALLDAAWARGKKIVMLEPRRLAARAVAARMAFTLNEAVGRTLGYRTRLETRVGATTRIEVVTEGILTRWLQRDPALEEVAIVIFDEFHERSLQADLGLALTLDAQATLREDLRVLVMSATLDGEAVSRLLGDAPVVTSSGRAYPVDTHYRQPLVRGSERPLADIVATTVVNALETEHGDALVFLPGQADIHRTQRLLHDRALPRGTRVLPLYGDLPLEQQDEAIKPSTPGTRKVVLATNIAETSLTIEGVRLVIDAGLERRMRFNPATGMSRLETLRISRASADQRRGRAGRLESGVCYRLWSESEQSQLLAQTPAEILEADLAPLALELASWGVTQPLDLRWLDPPPSAAFSQAQDLLRSLEGIDRDGRITEHGRAITKLGTHPRLAHMIMKALELDRGQLALQIAALLGERDVLRSSDGRANARDIDLRLRVDALRDRRGLPPEVSIDPAARQRVMRSIEQLQRQLGRIGARDDADTDSDRDTGRLLALAYPDRIAMSRGASGRYLLSSGRGALLHGVHSLAQAEFLVVADLDSGERDATIRLAAPIERNALEALFAGAIETRERIEWDSREQSVIARRERWFGALRIAEQRLEQADSDRVAAAMIAGIRELGIAQLPWSKQARALQTRMEFARRADPSAPAQWPNVSDAALFDTLDTWLAPWLDGVTRRDHLSRLDLHATLLALLNWDQQQRLNQLAPTHLVVPTGSRIPIDYAGASPSVAVRLQELFGLRTTPTIGVGNVPLTLHLLSPAHRPVQVTQDLASFWIRGYPDVKKELKGRYPKHYWPDDPLAAAPTARAKPRARE